MAGLPDYGGSRRVPGLRRAEVALLAGVSPDHYVRLERGNLSGVSDGVLEAIARALRLDEAERCYLYDLARAVKALTDLIGELVTRTDDFRVRWAAHNVRLHHTGVKHFNQQAVGRIDVAVEAMPMPADPGLTLTVYSAEPGTASWDALRLLGAWNATAQEANR